MSLPYFPMYPTDFEAKTSHLTLEEDGAYNRLLRIMWMMPHCSLPNDDKWIMRRMRVSQEVFDSVVSVVIDEFMIKSNGRIINKRLLEEYQKTNVAHGKRVEAGRKGGNANALKTKEKASSNAKAMPKQPEPEPEPYKGSANALVRFDEFWNVYDKKRNRKKCVGIWKQKRLGEKADEIIKSATLYSKANEPQFRKDPERWLRDERWNDELSSINGSVQVLSEDEISKRREKLKSTKDINFVRRPKNHFLNKFKPGSKFTPEAKVDND